MLNRAGERLTAGNQAHFQRALETADVVPKKAPSYVSLYGERARSLCGLGRLAVQQKQVQDAQSLLSAGVEAWKDYHRLAPELDPFLKEATACSNEFARVRPR